MSLDAAAFRRIASACAEALGRRRAEIDALNVFPVPDADTGTNVYLTVQAAHDALVAAGDADPAELLEVFADGALLGARGNSGVILSQLVRAAFAHAGADVDPPRLAEAFAVASEAAYDAVGEPEEGTILSVARAAAEGARSSAGAGADLLGVWSAATRAAEEALERTTEQMDRLARAGVVDAGGQALVALMQAVERYFTGGVDPYESSPRPVPVPLPAPGDDLVEGGPAYEVMYLLRCADEAVPELRRSLAPLGDSLVVVGGGGLWNVHIHVDDVGAAIEAGITAGSPYRIQVTHFADQIAAPAPRSGRAVVAAVTGRGLAELCRDSGAVVVEFDRGSPLSVEAATTAFRQAAADEIVALPNNPRYVSMFEAAAASLREEGARVAVIPSHAQVQGLAALAVHDPGRSFDDDVVAMSSAAAHTGHGAVTVASEAGITMAGAAEKGDVLGVVDGDFAIIGRDLVEVGLEVLDRLISPTTELVTIVSGAEDPGDLAERLAKHVRQSRHGVDTVVYDGGQENYPVFLAVE